MMDRLAAVAPGSPLVARESPLPRLWEVISDGG
jgi:hypothetical protein